MPKPIATSSPFEAPTRGPRCRDSRRRDLVTVPGIRGEADILLLLREEPRSSAMEKGADRDWRGRSTGRILRLPEEHAKPSSP